MTAQAFPLQWPPHIPRSKTRERSKFKTSLFGALKNVRTSIEMFGRDSGRKVTDIVLSSNVALGNDRPADPGIAAWLVWDGMSICIPVDRYLTPEENLQAIHHIIEARRTELRHGTLHLVKATFQGFSALPPPPGAKPKRPWREVFGWTESSTPKPDLIEARFRELAKTRHPDAGGSHEAMQELIESRKEALAQ